MSLIQGDIGRDDQQENIVHDAPNKTVETMLRNQDLVIDAIKAIAAQLDADTGVNDTDYASGITDSLVKLQMIL